jgi:hypothetical protein
MSDGIPRCPHGFDCQNYPPIDLFSRSLLSLSIAVQFCSLSSLNCKQFELSFAFLLRIHRKIMKDRTMFIQTVDIEPESQF